MDVTSITGAYQGLKAAKDILGVLFDAKVDAEAKPKILEALQKLGEAQDTLFALREELFSLQTTNGQLRQEIADSKTWQSTASQYDLVKTAGGAVVYKFKGEPEHFACPSCFNLKQVHILQTNRTMSGKFRCTGCSSEFPVDPQKHYAPQVVRSRSPFA
jgi:hypothetical protein